MKVLDLQCGLGHVFEGWFASHEDFESQTQRGLVQCPVCGDAVITKRLSAPRLNLGARELPAVAPAEGAATTAAADAPARALSPAPGQTDAPPPAVAALQAAWLRLAREVVARTEDVGSGFATEARRMHYGETAERAIRGQATRDEAQALLDEGIEILPLPALAKGTLQ